MPQEFLSLISSVGFPIAACMALFWKLDKNDKLHREEMESFQKVLENNTIALTTLCERMEGLDINDYRNNQE